MQLSGHCIIVSDIIVLTLADRGIYIASESTFYRVLKTVN